MIPADAQKTQTTMALPLQWDILGKYVPRLHICHDIMRQAMTQLRWENVFDQVQTIINLPASEAFCGISHCIQPHT